MKRHYWVSLSWCVAAFPAWWPAVFWSEFRTLGGISRMNASSGGFLQEVEWNVCNPRSIFKVKPAIASVQKTTNVLGKRHLEGEEVEGCHRCPTAPCNHPRPVPSAGKALLAWSSPVNKKHPFALICAHTYTNMLGQHVTCCLGMLTGSGVAWTSRKSSSVSLSESSAYFLGFCLFLLLSLSAVT